MNIIMKQIPPMAILLLLLEKVTVSGLVEKHPKAVIQINSLSGKMHEQHTEGQTRTQIRHIQLTNPIPDTKIVRICEKIDCNSMLEQYYGNLFIFFL
jgi:hypothetical protein